MIEIKPARELGENAKKTLSDFFVDGFHTHLSVFAKDPKKLAAALEHMFVPDVFHVGFVDGEPAGMIACTNGLTRSVNHSRRELIRHLGWIKGLFADYMFKRQFQQPPVEIGERIASVEFVATASRHRGKGVATAIMHHLLSLPQYDEYVLEVADTNTNAVKLYEKLEFREFKRIKHKYAKYSGINYILYMKYTKSPTDRIL
jgi:ribosomal protein S18 acetylase RimI-like enzyme